MAPTKVSAPAPPKKGRGRPKGSVKKPKTKAAKAAPAKKGAKQAKKEEKKESN